MAADLGRWWRTLSGVKLFSKGKPNSPKPMPNGQAVEGNARQETEQLGPVLKGKPNSPKPMPKNQAVESNARQETEQLAPVLRELIARQEKLLQEQAQRRDTAGVASLSRELLEDAERQAAGLRARAIRESEVEAARIVTQAKQQAQQIISEARRDAQEASRAEVENIMAAARKRAEISEARANQVAQLFLLRAREDVHSIVTGEAKEGYYRLLSALQDVIAASHAIEKEWKDRSVQLWETAGLRWEEYEGALVGSLGHGQLAAPEYSPNAGTSTPREQAVQTSPRTTAVTLGPTPDSVAVMAPEEEEDDQGQSSSARGTEVAAPEVEAAAPGRAAAMKEETPEIEAAAPGHSAVAEEEAIRISASLQEALSGEVEVVVAPFPDVERLAALYTHLQTVNGLRVLHSTGSWDKGTVVTVVLDRPLAVGDLVPSNLGARVSFERGKPGTVDGAGQHLRLILDFSGA